MGFADILGVTEISASGMSAERLRMEVVANNIANAHSTRTPAGGPYRRKEVVFGAVLDSHLGGRGISAASLRGVRVLGVVDDKSELPRVYDPGHPDADDDGFVTMPNVQLPTEMVDLITASRGYEANLRVLRLFRQMAERALSILVRA